MQSVLKDLVSGLIADPTGHPLGDPIIARQTEFDTIEPDDSLGILTIHRRANLSGNANSGLAQVLGQVAGLRQVNWLFPVYPMTAKLLKSADISLPSNVHPVIPLDHATMLDRVKHAGIIVSDSVGLQIEAGVAGRRLVAPRDETEYPELLSDSLVMAAPHCVGRAVIAVLSAVPPSAENLATMRTVFGDGKASYNLFQFIAQLTNKAGAREDSALAIAQG